MERPRNRTQRTKQRIRSRHSGVTIAMAVLAVFMFGAGIVILLLPTSVFAAWTEPSANPPFGNVAAPLNVSAIGQEKQGTLTVDATGAVNGVFSANGYTSDVRLKATSNSATNGAITAGVGGVGATASYTGGAPSLSAGVYGVASPDRASSGNLGWQVGLLGVASDNTGYPLTAGVYGWDNNNTSAYAGYFAGRVGVSGELCFGDGTCASSWGSLTGQTVFTTDATSKIIAPSSTYGDYSLAIGGTNSANSAFFLQVPNATNGNANPLLYTTGSIVVGQPNAPSATDGICTAGEGCSNADCYGQQANCTAGQICNPNTPYGCKDLTAPTTPQYLHLVSQTSTSITLQWNGSTDTGGSTDFAPNPNPPPASVGGYLLYRCKGTGCTVTQDDAHRITPKSSPLANTYVTDSGLDLDTPYRYAISSIDAGGNESLLSLTTLASTLQDTLAPTAPGTPTFSNITETGMTVQWAASTDQGGSGLSGYSLYRCTGTCSPDIQGIPVYSGTDTSFVDSGLSRSTTYSYKVVASDGAANKTPSGTGTASTLNDQSVPTPPTLISFAGTDSYNIIDLSWSGMTDADGASDITTYLIYRCQGASCTSDTQYASSPTASYHQINLTGNTTYGYAVKSKDAAGNISPKSSWFYVTTGSKTNPDPIPLSSAFTPNTTFASALTKPLVSGVRPLARLLSAPVAQAAVKKVGPLEIPVAAAGSPADPFVRFTLNNGALQLAPSTTPNGYTAQEGTMYYDQAAQAFKCYQKDAGDGTVKWMNCGGGNTGPGNLDGLTGTPPITINHTDHNNAVVKLTSPLDVTYGGTGTVTAFTPGSLVYAGASGVYTQDNANLFWDITNSRLGVGTNSPNAKTEIRGAAGGGEVLRLSSSTGNYLSTQVSNVGGVTFDATGSGAAFTFGDPATFNSLATFNAGAISRANASGIGTPLGLQNTIAAAAGSGAQVRFYANRTGNTPTVVGGVGGIITDIGAATYKGALVLSTYAAGDNVNPIERMRIDDLGNVGIGKTAAAAYKLDVNGKINTNAGICFSGLCATNWSDLIINSGASLSSVDQTTAAFNIGGNGQLNNLIALGTVNIKGGSSNFYSTLQGVLQTTDINYQLPASAPSSAGQALVTDTLPSPNPTNLFPLKWGSSGIGGSIADTQIAYGNASGQITGNPNFVYTASGNVGIGTAAPSSRLSVTPLQYNAGTASQALNTVTGVGTTFNSTMIGSQLVFANGVSAGTITAVSSATTLTVSTSQTVSPQAYSISYTGLQVGSNGSVGVNTVAPITQFHVSGYSASRYLSSLTADANPKTIAVQGRYAYVTNYTSGGKLEVFDISNPAFMVSVGALALATYYPKAIAVQGKYAYITSDQGGADGKILVIDISNPGSPSLIGTPIVLTGQRQPESIAVSGRYAYVVNAASGSNSLQVIDVAKPDSPTVLSTFTHGDLDGPFAITVNGRYAYVANNASSGTGKLVVIDISNPASPSFIKSAVTQGRDFGVAVSGRYAYVTSYNTTGPIGRLEIYLIDQVALSRVGSVQTDRQPMAVSVQDRYAYVVNAGDRSGSIPSKLQTIDISNPASPQIVGSAPTPASTYDFSAIAVNGRYAYVTNANSNVAEKIVAAFDLGGAYTQQLESGGLETDTLSTRSNAQIGNDLSVVGGITTARGISSSGSISANTGGNTTDAISGFSSSSSKSAIYGENANGYAGYFSGNFSVNVGSAFPTGYIGKYANLAAQSESFNTVPWGIFGRATITDDGGDSPDGSHGTADQIVFTSTSDRVKQDFSLAANTDYTLSVWAKAAGSETFRFVASYGSPLYSPDQAVTTTWQRFTWKVNNGTASNPLYVGLGDAAAGGNHTVIFWGFQLERSSIAGPYLHTTTSSLNGSGVVAPSLFLDTVDATPPAGANGQVYYDAGLGKFRCYEAGAWKNCIGGSGGSSALSSITAATGANTISNGNNGGQVWNWNLTTANSSALTLGESAASTGTGTAILKVATLANSTADSVSAYSSSPTKSAVYAQQDGAGYAGYFSGKFQVNGTALVNQTASPTSSLTRAMAVGDVSAYVNSVIGFPQVGTIRIDSELMSYTGTVFDGTDYVFQNLIRGINGTTKAAHSLGAAVDASSVSVFTAANNLVPTFSVTSNGNVGVGTGAPNWQFTLSKGTGQVPTEAINWTDPQQYGQLQFVENFGGAVGGIEGIGSTYGTSSRRNLLELYAGTQGDGIAFRTGAKTGGDQERVRIDNNGNVHINDAGETTNPLTIGTGDKFQVTSAGRVLVNNPSNDLSYNIVTAGGGIKAVSSVAANPAGFFSNTAAGTPYALLVDKGNVGIGTLTPTAKLELASGGADTTGLKFTNISSNSVVGSGNNGKVLALDTSGNVIQVTDATTTGGSGDVTDVGDCTGPVCFQANGTSTGNSLYFEGIGANDANEVQLTAANPTSDVAVTIPGLAGTIAVLQASSPGTQQTGTLNISANGIFGGNLTVTGNNIYTATNAADQTLIVSNPGTANAKLSIEGLGTGALYTSSNVITPETYLNPVRGGTGLDLSTNANQGGALYKTSNGVGVVTTAASDASKCLISNGTSMPTWGSCGGGIGGSGTQYYLPMFSGPTSITNSPLYRATGDNAVYISPQYAAPEFREGGELVWDSVPGTYGIRMIVDSYSNGADVNTRRIRFRTQDYDTGTSDWNGDVERLSILDNGNIGIGTYAPSQKLEIGGGNIKIANGQTLIFGDSAGANGFTLGVTSGSNNAVINQANVASLDLQTSSTSRLYITSDGNVGIGTNNPLKTLDVNGSVRLESLINCGVLTTGSSGDVSCGSVGTNYWSLTGNTGTDPLTKFIGTTDSKDFVVKTSNTERLRVLSGGNIGVGQTAPSALLEVGTTTFTANNTIAAFNASTSAYNALAGYKSGNNVQGSGVYGQLSDGSCAGTCAAIYGSDGWNSANTYAGYFAGALRTTGNLGAYSTDGRANLLKAKIVASSDHYHSMGMGLTFNIGQDYFTTSAPANNLLGEYMDIICNDNDRSQSRTVVYSAGSTSQQFYVDRAFTRNSDSFDCFVAARAQAAWPSVASFADYLGTTKLFVQGGTGNVGINTYSPQYQLDVNGLAHRSDNSASWTVSSDARLKTNIQPLHAALDSMLQLRGVTFEWQDPSRVTNGTGEKMGLIAQEVEKVFPQWVTTDVNGYKSVTISGFEALTVESLRDINNKTEELKKKNADLERRVQKLEQKLEGLQ